MVTNAKSPGSRCYGLVTMGSADEASKCIQYLHRTELSGRMISVERVKAELYNKTVRNLLTSAPVYQLIKNCGFYSSLKKRTPFRRGTILQHRLVQSRRRARNRHRHHHRQRQRRRRTATAHHTLTRIMSMIKVHCVHTAVSFCKTTDKKKWECTWSDREVSLYLARVSRGHRSTHFCHIRMTKTKGV